MPSSCCVRGCTNRQSFYGYSMFGFPNDPDIKSQWVEAIRTSMWEPKPHQRICEVHFEPASINFVGSRKEPKRNAVPTLFCNCACQQLMNEAQEKCNVKSQILVGERLIRATMLDHTYCHNLGNITDRDKDSEVNTARRKSLKHDSDCNLMREALKNTPVKQEDTLSNHKPAMHLNKLLVNPPKKNLVNKTSKGKLKSQLHNALVENAKLKRELSMLKGRVIPSHLLGPSNIRVVRLEKIA